MHGKLRRWLQVAALVLVASGAPLALAEPYLAVANGLKCSACHVNPTGGGMRNTFGSIWGQTMLPVRSFDVSTDRWTGDISRFVGIGADLRGGGTYTDQPGAASTNAFDLNSLRVYVELRPIPEMMSLYVDERLAPGEASNAEAYLRMWTPGRRYYVKAGQMYLPFGIRLQDDSAYVRGNTGISFNTPDRGIEFGIDGTRFTTQLAISNGTAGASEVDQGKQWSLRTEYVQSRFRAGASFNFNDFEVGSRRMQGVFAGLRTARIAWLAEIDQIVDAAPGPDLTQWAGLLEANWAVRKGHNIKVTAERFDPDDDATGDRQTRLSLLYEYTPLPFLQLRAGFRNYDDGAGVAFLNQRIAFVQLHGYL